MENSGSCSRTYFVCGRFGNEGQNRDNILKWREEVELEDGKVKVMDIGGLMRSLIPRGQGVMKFGHVLL